MTKPRPVPKVLPGQRVRHKDYPDVYTVEKWTADDVKLEGFIPCSNGVALHAADIVLVKRGRPATGKNAMIAIRWPPLLLKAIDRYAKAHGLVRHQALRRIVTEFFERKDV